MSHLCKQSQPLIIFHHLRKWNLRSPRQEMSSLWRNLRHEYFWPSYCLGGRKYFSDLVDRLLEPVWDPGTQGFHRVATLINMHNFGEHNIISSELWAKQPWLFYVFNWFHPGTKVPTVLFLAVFYPPLWTRANKHVPKYVMVLGRRCQTAARSPPLRIWRGDRG